MLAAGMRLLSLLVVVVTAQVKPPILREFGGKYYTTVLYLSSTHCSCLRIRQVHIAITKGQFVHKSIRAKALTTL